MADPEVVAERARLLAARRRDEWSDDDVVAALVGLSGGDAAVLEQAWRQCARRDGDPLTRAAGSLLHRAWARTNGLRETILAPGRPGSPAPPARPPADAVATGGVATVPPPPASRPSTSRWRRLFRVPRRDR